MRSDCLIGSEIRNWSRFEVDRRQFSSSVWINTSLCHSVVGVTCQSTVLTTDGATDQLKSGSRYQSQSNRLKDLGLFSRRRT
jgi:hypothetical protein